MASMSVWHVSSSAHRGSHDLLDRETCVKIVLSAKCGDIYCEANSRASEIARSRQGLCAGTVALARRSNNFVRSMRRKPCRPHSKGIPSCRHGRQSGCEKAALLSREFNRSVTPNRRKLCRLLWQERVCKGKREYKSTQVVDSGQHGTRS